MRMSEYVCVALRYTVKPAYNGTAKYRFFFIAGRFPLIQALEVRMLGTPDPGD